MDQTANLLDGRQRFISTVKNDSVSFKGFTLPPKKRLFRNFLRKNATKKVPIMSTRDRRAVLGWLKMGLSKFGKRFGVVGSVGYIAISGCSLNTWKQGDVILY